MSRRTIPADIRTLYGPEKEALGALALGALALGVLAIEIELA